MTTTALAGVNIYSVMGLLIATALFFHFTSKEETVMMMVAAVAIIYLLTG